MYAIVSTWPNANAMSWKHFCAAGKQAAGKLKRAQILQAADVGATDEEIAATVGVGGSTVCRTKRRFVEGERALSEEPRPGAERKLTGKEGGCWWRPPARILRPAGRVGRWTCSRTRSSS